jgi:hypothetical protein
MAPTVILCMHSILLSRRTATAVVTTLAVGAIPYPTVRPVEEYLLARDAEITLARTAAPTAISREATILVLGRRGYETAVQGTNGFPMGRFRSLVARPGDPVQIAG